MSNRYRRAGMSRYLTIPGHAMGFVPDQETLDVLNAISSEAGSGFLYVPEPGLLSQDSLWTTSSREFLVSESGDPVGRWDSIYETDSLLQASLTSRPQYLEGSGLMSVSGDGLSQHLVSEQNVPWLTSSTAEAFFAIAFSRSEGAGVGYVVHCDLDVNSRSEQSLSVLSNVSGSDEINIGGTSFSIPATPYPAVLYVQFNKATGEGIISWNGAEETPISFGSVSRENAPMRILSRSGGAYLDGSVYGIVGKQGVLPYESRRLIMDYLIGRS